MNSVAEAIQTLVNASQLAHSKGVFNLEEAHYIYLAIDYLNKISQEAGAQQEAPQQVVNETAVNEEAGHDPNPGTY